jgi:hypothetical protein
MNEATTPTQGWGRRLEAWARRHRLLLAGCGAALALYALLGFLVLPGVVRRQITERLGALLQREVSIQRVRTNPFALSVTIDGFLVKQPNGAPAVSWDRLYVNYDLWPLVLKEIRFSAIALQRPYVELALLRDGTTNLGQLVQALQGPEAPAPEKPAEKPGRPWTLGVDDLAIEGASLAFRDDTRPGPFRSTLGPMSVRVQSFHTRADSRSPYSFSGKTESGEGFSWNGTFFIDPLRSQGAFSLDGFRIPKYAPYYQPRVGFEIRDGAVSVKASYELEWSAARRVLRLQGGSLDLRTLVLALPGAAEPFLELPALEVAGVDADVLGGSAEVGSVTLRQPLLRVRRDRAGALNLATAAAPPQGGAAAPSPAPAPAAPAEARPAAPGAAGKAAAEPFRYLVKQVALQGGRVDFQDQVPERPVRLDLQQVTVTLGNLASDPEARSPLEASLLWNGEGRVEAKGEIQANRQRGEVALRVEGMSLPPIDPYLLAYGDLDLRLGAGRLGTDLRLRFDQSGKEPSYEVSGEARIDGLSAADGPRNVELLRWRSLQVAGMQVTTRPPRAAIRSVTWVEPQVRVQVDRDGSSNVARLRRTPPGEAKAAAAAKTTSATPPAAAAGGTAGTAAEAATASAPGGVPAPTGPAPSPGSAPGAPAAATGPAPSSSPPAGAVAASPAPARAAPRKAAPPARGEAQASLGTFQILRGRLGFSDRSLDPAVALACTDLQARARGVSTAPSARPEVSASCKVWGASPLEISGTLHPRFQGDGTRIKVASKGIDLTPLGPYAGKYMGYGLQKGKLDLDLGYAVVQRQLDSTNVVRIDQLTLGEKVDSPDATSLPVKLGLAVLRDRDGVILLDVPVSGNVDDPDFRVGRVVWRAIGNVFIKAATAPFALLASAFGGGKENLDFLEFPPGSAELDEAGQGKARVLAKALFERPALQLEIEGTTDQAADGASLRRRALLALLRRTKATAEKRPPDSVEVAPAEVPRWLEAAWKAAFPAQGRPAREKPPTPAEMEQQLMESLPVSPAELRELASQRAAAAQGAILAAAQVEPGRVFLVEGGERAAKEKGARAWFTLK